VRVGAEPERALGICQFAAHLGVPKVEVQISLGLAAGQREVQQPIGQAILGIDHAQPVVRAAVVVKIAAADLEPERAIAVLPENRAEPAVAGVGGLVVILRQLRPFHVAAREKRGPVHRRGPGGGGKIHGQQREGHGGDDAGR
jgi:hypothetical protein